MNLSSYQRLMATGRKPTDGCWTCRVRRKRCDSMRPVCENCQSLLITCHFADQKPTWMDGAAEQKKMAQKIKDEIKQNAFRQREKRSQLSQEQEIDISLDRDHRKGPASDSAFQPAMAIKADTVKISIGDEEMTFVSAPEAYTEPMTVGGYSVMSSGASWTPSSPMNEPYTPPSVMTIIQSSTNRYSSKDAGATRSNLGTEVELGFLMIYLDYVFPFLFPFYRPPLLETGRHWLLNLLCRNEVSFHTAASLSAYFFSVASQDGGQEMHSSCKAIVWEQLMSHMDIAFRAIQQDINEINHRGVQAALIESTHVLSEIIQFLIVEITVRRNVEWTIHLTPALVLFEDLFKYHGTSSSQPNLDFILRQMPRPFHALPMEHAKPLPNTADQSALVFFIATLLFIDIISSTALDNLPRLKGYHLNLLRDNRTTEVQIELEVFVGCQNWVLLVISDISTLNAWKKNANSVGTLSVVDLVNRAGPISQALERGLTGLDNNMTDRNIFDTAAGRLDGYHTRIEDRSTGYASMITATRVWAYAAHIYLFVVLSGWQPASAEVHNSVTKVLALLQDIRSPAQLRSFAWPLCIAGCLALPYQEQEVRFIVESMGDLCVFGTISTAKDIIEAVWKSRDTLDKNTWDIAACLGILGSPALLV